MSKPTDAAITEYAFRVLHEGEEYAQWLAHRSLGDRAANELHAAYVEWLDSFRNRLRTPERP